MGKEIERKFLVRDDSWRPGAGGTLYRQGYLSTSMKRVVRVRIFDKSGFLTVKGVTRGICRAEYEYEIPFKDACEMLDHLCRRPLIEKNRYRIEYGGLTWEVDEFLGENAGLVLAEVELALEDQEINLPPWIGKEVSEDPRYFNANLVENPYRRWATEKGGGSPP